MRLLKVLLLAASVSSLGAQEKFVVQLFHDEDKSSLTLTDLKFPSARRGVALGFLTERGGRVRGTAVVTSDGGEHWSYVPTKEIGTSLFFLNETAGWMVTQAGIWFTDEGGRSWRRILKREGLHRVYFIDAERGWALGGPKLLLATRDGGKTWKKVPEADKPRTDASTTSYNAIGFGTPKFGLIAGRSRPMRRNRLLPSWAETKPERQREWPSTLIVLQTRDGGESWTSSLASVFGSATQVRFAGDGRLVVLLEFEDYFEWPSELLKIDPRTGKSATVFRDRKSAITDVELVEQGPAYAVGFEPPGRLAHSPMPGKVKVLRSEDLEHWTGIPVDYRALASRAFVAAAGPRDVWVATDAGMILKLQSSAPVR
ncbi:MAG TPA: YCF48-related protein [Bryobacteraceae bacterium]|nr:YCF48-related protein [Bryobacteraceae bacterium]